MFKVGLLSDTHGFLDQAVFRYFADCDEIWHAGDIGDAGTYEELARFKPVQAVSGNIDNHLVRACVPSFQYFVRNGCRILITHIAGPALKYNSETRNLMASNPCDILVCGHSHILKVIYDKPNKLLYMNPGAAGNHGFHKVKTLLRFNIQDGKPLNLEVIEFGNRGMNTP